MMFEEIPLINSGALFRRAGVTPYYGRRVQEQLARAGRITPVVTGTGRSQLTALDGKVLFDALTKAA